jgi:hypothetical protein
VSTRSNIIAIDQYDRVQIYRHWDGYPSCVLPDLLEAFKYAWPTPRFEAADFLASVIRAWKREGGGNVYIDGSPKAWEQIHGDTEWVYEIAGTDEGIKVKVYDWHNYWLDKVNARAMSFRPSPVRTVEIKPTTTREELRRIWEEIEKG